MSTIRAYSNSKRISTGRVTKDGRFFQAYPTKVYYMNEKDWRDAWVKNTNLEFIVEEVVKSLTERRSSIRKKATVTHVARSQPASAAPQTTPLPVEKPYNYYREFVQTLPAGRYYIGDLCYAMKDDVYNGVFGGNGYASGFYKTKDGIFLLNRTAYGDGSYKGSNDFDYGVDAGIIGIASMSVCNPEKDVYGGTLHTFTEPVVCTFKNGGVFEFNSGDWFLEIDTALDFDDDASY